MKTIPDRNTTVLLLCLFALVLALPNRSRATENVPRSAYAQWADVPDKGQLKIGLTYQESEAYYIWDPTTRYNVDARQNGEHYGIDVNQGYLSFDYGITTNWAADLSIGFVTMGWRYFNTNGQSPEATTGLMDSTLGIRYQIFREKEGDWKPTMSFRAAGVLPGSFNQSIAFAPGTRSAAIEPSLMMRKHFGWTGFGGYLDGLFRWNKTTANDLYIVSVGFFQQIQRWELDAGYRHLGSVGGDDIVFPDPPGTTGINYPRGVREHNDSIEAGFHYITKKHKIKLGFYSRTVFDGGNSDQKFWVGGFVEMPFQIVKPKSE